MDINILSSEELLNYAQSQTELEIKLFEAALHFQSEMQDAVNELADHKREVEFEESETIYKLQDDLAQVKAGLQSAISKIEIGKIDDAVNILKDYV